MNKDQRLNKYNATSHINTPNFKPTPIKNILSSAAIVGLFAITTLSASVSNATPPEHAQQGFSKNSMAAQSNSKRSGSEEFARGRILVMPRAGLPAHTFKEILNEHHGRAKKLGQSDIYVIELPEFSEESAVARLQDHPHIKFAELDYIVNPALTPTDPVYVNEWHVTKINGSIAWDSSQGNGITVAILDSGIDSSHPDLVANIVPGWNFFDNNSNTADVTGHGTGVSGIAAAVTNNGLGVASIAGQSKIMPLRIADSGGNGYISMIADALIYAADRGVRVANISYTNTQSNFMVQNAAQYMKDKGGLVAVSAGNTYSQENFTVTNTVIPVSATDINDNKTNFSSYGDFVAMAAPGDGVWSTHSGGDYWSISGTSTSSPIVAGVIALMMSANPQLNSSEIENLLYATAVDLGTAGRDSYFGYGRVDAAAAVQAAVNAVPTLDTTAPTVLLNNPLEGATVSSLTTVDVDAVDNIGVTRVELWVNNTNIATDTSHPFAFSWDTTGAPNGTAKIEIRAYDAAGNVSSDINSVNVSNENTVTNNDTQAPAITITNPTSGSVSGTITISTSATDNAGSAGITQYLYIDGALKATGTGSTLSMSWNTKARGIKLGKHTIQAVAADAAGNATSASVIVDVKK